MYVLYSTYVVEGKRGRGSDALLGCCGRETGEAGGESVPRVKCLHLPRVAGGSVESAHGQELHQDDEEAETEEKDQSNTERPVRHELAGCIHSLTRREVTALTGSEGVRIASLTGSASRQISEIFFEVEALAGEARRR